MIYRAAKISVPAIAALTAKSASRPFYQRLALFLFSGFCLLPSAFGTNVRLGPFTNSISLQPDTNAVILYPVSGPVANADGSFTTIGVPKRIYPTADGSVTNSLAANNYLATNAYIAPGIVFRVPQDSGPTVYRMYDLRLSGYNTFVTVYLTNGAAGSVTYDTITNALGFAPLATNQVPGITNGFIRFLDATNVANAAANSASNSLYSDYATRIAILTALSITNLYATNAPGVSWVAGRGYISTNYDALGTALAMGAASTNYTLAASNALFSLHSLSISNLFATNAAGVTYAGGRGYVSTNYDALGAALAIGLQATNYTLAASNNLYSDYTTKLALKASLTQTTNLVQAATNGYSSLVFTNPAQVFYTNALPALTNGFWDKSLTNNAATRAELISATNGISGSVGISALTATNIFNSLGGVVATNGANLTTKFTSSGTNAILAITEPLTNGFVDKSITNNAATKAYAQSLTNGFVDRSITNGFATQAYAQSLTNGFAAQSALNKKADTNAPIIWTPVLFGPIEADTNNEATNVFGGLLTILGNAVQEGAGTASGALSHAEGNTTTASGAASHAEGNATTASGGFGAHAEGFSTTSSGSETHAEGFGTSASGTASHAEGSVTVASGTASHAAGQNANATNNNSFVWSDSTSTGSVTNKTFTVFASNGIKLSGGVITGNGAGITNTTATNFGPAGLILITNIASGVIIGGGINASTATNISAFIVGQSNAPIISSNALLFVGKVDSTNGFATGLNSTNTALLGNVSFGADGADINILSANGTNYIGFYNAGSAQATNGCFQWMSGLNCYSNTVTAAILTNNSTAWLLQTNGVTLYSLSGANPIGTYTAVSGALPAPFSVKGFAWDLNRMVMIGYLSAPNIQILSNTITTNVTITVSNNFIANNGGYGTNGRLYGFRFLWDNPERNNANNFQGAQLDFASAAFGQANTNIGSGYGAAILSGATNRLNIDGAGVIVGGTFNALGGGSGNADVIIGGSSNTLTGVGGIGAIGGNLIGAGYKNTLNTAFFSSILGGVSNSINGSYSAILGGWGNTNLQDGGVILGGQTNRVNGKWSVAAGRNVTVNHDDVFSWSGGIADTSTTNSQARITATNGLALNGPLFLGAANTNNGVYYLSNAPFSLFAITNGMPNFAHCDANSNGSRVDIKMSNGVPFMTILAP